MGGPLDQVPPPFQHTRMQRPDQQGLDSRIRHRVRPRGREPSAASCVDLDAVAGALGRGTGLVITSECACFRSSSSSSSWSASFSPVQPFSPLGEFRHCVLLGSCWADIKGEGGTVSIYTILTVSSGWYVCGAALSGKRLDVPLFCGLGGVILPVFIPAHCLHSLRSLGVFRVACFKLRCLRPCSLLLVDR
jgi:hypothetical protein